MKKNKSILMLKNGHIKGYYNYIGREEIDDFSTDSNYTLRIIPLFDKFYLTFFDEWVSKKTAIEYVQAYKKRNHIK